MPKPRSPEDYAEAFETLFAQVLDATGASHVDDVLDLLDHLRREGAVPEGDRREEIRVLIAYVVTRLMEAGDGPGTGPLPALMVVVDRTQAPAPPDPFATIKRRSGDLN